MRELVGIMYEQIAINAKAILQTMHSYDAK